MACYCNSSQVEGKCTEDRVYNTEFSNYMKDEVTKMFENILNYVELVVDNKKDYSVLRGKILGTGNKCIRNVQDKLNMYSVFLNGKEYNEDYIYIKQ